MARMFLLDRFSVAGSGVCHSLIEARWRMPVCGGRNEGGMQ
jgi:hypothetical protein